MYLVAENNLWIIVTHRRRSFDPGVALVARADGAAIALTLVGDTGKNSPQRTQVVDAIARHSRGFDHDAVLLLGDNFYEERVIANQSASLKSPPANQLDVAMQKMALTAGQRSS